MRRLHSVGVPACTLLTFAFEGDNTPDALRLADATEALLGVCFRGVPSSPEHIFLDEAPIQSGIGLVDLDRDYSDEESVCEAPLPRRPWLLPTAWHALLGGPPPVSW